MTMSYNINTLVSTEEQQALKEMIFKRARERALAFNQEVQNNYTTAIQNDVMELARDCFVATKNPFCEEKKEENQETSAKKDSEIGFQQRNIEEIKAQIKSRNQISSEKVANITLENNMTEARNEFSQRSTFLGALEFLNSQASISLIKSRGKSFEALA